MIVKQVWYIHIIAEPINSLLVQLYAFTSVNFTSQIYHNLLAVDLKRTPDNVYVHEAVQDLPDFDRR